MIFRCTQCDTTRDSDCEDNTAATDDGLVCSACVEVTQAEADDPPVPEAA